MKTFKMKHLFFHTSVEFTEDNPPEHLLSREFKWWWTKHVLTLEIGKSIKSDFQQITRLT